MRSTTVIIGLIVLSFLSSCATGLPPMHILARQLRSSNPTTRVKALEQVPQYGTAGEKVLPMVVESFRDRRTSVHQAADKTLVAMKEPGAQALGSLLSDQDSWVRCRAASALTRMPADASVVVPALVEALRDSDFCVAEKAAVALGAVGDVAVPSLLEALKSTNSSARKGAAQALSYMGPAVHEKVVSFILPSLLSKDEFLRGEAAMRVTHLGKLGIPVFLAAIKNADVDLRQKAVDGLGEIGIPTPDVVEALIVLFKDSQPTLRLKGAVVLGQMGQRDVSVYKAVAPLLASQDKEVLVGALHALGDMGAQAEPSLPQISRIIEENSNAKIRSDAAESLIKMGTRASLAVAERYTRGEYQRRSRE